MIQQRKSIGLAFLLILLLSFQNVTLAEKTGDIIFTSKDDATATDGKGQFDILDNIYVNVFLDNTLSNYYKENNYTYDFREKRLNYNYALRIYNNNELMGQWLYEMPEESFETTRILHFPLATDVEYEKHRYGNMVNSWVDLVSRLKEGNHQVEMRMVLLYEDIQRKNPPVLAEGKFKLSVKNEMMAQFREKYKTGLPEATVLAPVIEEKIVQASEEVINGAVPLAAIITDVTGDWSYTYDEHGNILYRHIVASVVYQLRDGTCWVKAGYYSQKHKGYGDFDDMIFSRDAEGYSDYEIDCKLAEDILVKIKN